MAVLQVTSSGGQKQSHVLCSRKWNLDTVVARTVSATNHQTLPPPQEQTGLGAASLDFNFMSVNAIGGHRAGQT